MKNSPMPARKKPMPRGEGPKRKTSMSPGGKALERATAKKRKSPPKTAPKPVIDVVKDRSLGLCEIGLVCLGNAPGTETAHRRGKGSGGVGRKNITSNVASNLLRGCHEDAWHIDNAEVADAERLGLKLRHTRAHPHEMPVHHYQFGWVLLDNEGGHRPAPHASWDRSRGGEVLPVIALTEVHMWVDWDPFNEAIRRFGHQDCGLHEPHGCEGAYVCPCGAEVFVIEAPS